MQAIPFSAKSPIQTGTGTRVQTIFWPMEFRSFSKNRIFYLGSEEGEL
jgi:hypothetical protein